MMVTLRDASRAGAGEQDILIATHCTPRIGTEVKASKEALLSGAVAGELRALLEARGVLVFRGAAFTDDDELAFAKTIGDVRTGNVQKKAEDGTLKEQKEAADGIFKVSLTRHRTPYFAEYLIGTFVWHIDGTWEEVPPLASILTPRILSPKGGQTEFANTYAAYDDLSAEEKERLEGLSVIHTMEANYKEVVPNPTEEQVKDWRSYPERMHPLVWRHRSGRKSLVLGSSATSIVGMGRAESDALLQRLKEWAARPEYVYRHHWQTGDVLMWDNTGTMHRVLHYDLDCGRRLHRVTLNGEEAIAA
jgi:alpha-ketoglutarate-dependent taurine dioxygenase